MESIASKNKMAKSSVNVTDPNYKFLMSLQVASEEEIVQIRDYLSSKGIVISKDAQNKIYGNTFAEIQSRVEAMERIGELGAYVEDPVRINSKGAVQRLEYLKNIDEPYKTPEGKYSKLPFRKKAFEAKYGIEYLKSAPEMRPEITAPEIDNAQKIKVTEVISAPQVSSSKDGEVEEMVVTTNFSSPLEEILSKPQTIGLNDETFDRYERLADGIRHVMISVYGIEEINDTITDNLIKLVTNEVMDDSMVMYYAITYGKTITPEEEERLKNAIGEELEYTSILEINLGGIAA